MQQRRKTLRAKPRPYFGDFARSGVEVLIEVMAALREAGLDRQITVCVDGGIRRGTDIFKCLALGADGVGIGRPVLHGLAP